MITAGFLYHFAPIINTADDTIAFTITARTMICFDGHLFSSAGINVYATNPVITPGTPAIIE